MKNTLHGFSFERFKGKKDALERDRMTVSLVQCLCRYIYGVGDLLW